MIAVLIAAFAIFELSPRFEKLSFDMKYIPLGGALSGFFGGLSGQQGALRSAFLIRAGLKKEKFIGTSVVSAVVVDISRLIVYGVTFFSKHFVVFQNQIGMELITAAILVAFLWFIYRFTSCEKNHHAYYSTYCWSVVVIDLNRTGGWSGMITQIRR